MIRRELKCCRSERQGLPSSVRAAAPKLGARPRRALILLALFLAAVLSSGGVGHAAAAPARLDTGFALFGEEHAEAEVVYPRLGEAGATTLRIVLNWRAVAPAGRTKPSSFDASDPLDAAYRWADFDRSLRIALSNGLTPIVNIYSAPQWAQGQGAGAAGTVRPSPAELGLFARAAAERYSGRFENLPRVRYWMVWNEPNLHLFLNPQFVGRQPVSPSLYRPMVNQMAQAVKSVHRDNVVIAGGTAPFRDLSITHTNWGPLGFMRELLCLDRNLRPKCRARVQFDVWSHHPYTSGGPTRKAVLPDDVSLGDLPEMRRVLQAGMRSGNVVSPRPPLFWVTEFSWDTRPPDPHGVPLALHRRWVAEAMFRMWQSGVSLVTWLSLRDQPLATSAIQAGLYFRGATLAQDRPKPSLQAFRFPFVAFPQHAQKRVYVWGRTPQGRQARVLVEQQFQGGWKRLGIVQTNRNGIFQARFATHRTGFVRARTVDRAERAAPFSLAHVPDRRFNPFGGRPLEP
jgi:hypothetical protein